MGTRASSDRRNNNRKDEAGMPRRPHPGQSQRTEPRDPPLRAECSIVASRVYSRERYRAGYSQGCIPGGYQGRVYTTKVPPRLYHQGTSSLLLVLPGAPLSCWCYRGAPLLLFFTRGALPAVLYRAHLLLYTPGCRPSCCTHLGAVLPAVPHRRKLLSFDLGLMLNSDIS